MTIDTSLLWRKVLVAVPRWVRHALVASIIVGECLHVIAKVLAPVVNTDAKSIVDLSAVAAHEWPLLGMIVTMPVAFCWHMILQRARGQTPFERAEEYIAILKIAAAAASLSGPQAKFFWNSALAKLANEFSVGSEPPNPKTLGTEIVQNDRP